jgi:hypothetical protein
MLFAIYSRGLHPSVVVDETEAPENFCKHTKKLVKKCLAFLKLQIIATLRIYNLYFELVVCHYENTSV